MEKVGGGPIALEYRFGVDAPFRWVVAGMGPDSGTVLSPDFASEDAAREFGRGMQKRPPP